MKNRTVAFLFLFLALSCIFILRSSKADVVKSKYFNYVEKGARVVKTSPSTQYKLMETYPQATVTVYEAGTLTLASLWVDRDGLVIKANPFTADTDSFYYFYVDCGKYDIKFSGTGITSPYSYGDIFICSSFSDNALTFNVGTSGTDFNVSQVGSTVTYNLPDASLLNRGAVTILDQSFNGNKTFDDNVIIDSGNLQFTGSTSGRITIQPASIAGTYTLTLPVDDGTSNQVLQTDGNGILSWATVSGGGSSGTVTDFSAGNLSPLFTTSVANSTTTPALTFNLSNVAANTYFGNNTGSSAAPSFITLSATSPIVISQGVGTTTLSCPTCGGGTLINPTDNRFPYRSNATTFLDSPLWREDANTAILRSTLGSGPGSTQIFVVAREYTSSSSWHGLSMNCNSTNCNLALINNSGNLVAPELNIGGGDKITFYSGGGQGWQFTTARDFIPSGSNGAFSIGDVGHAVNKLWMNKQIKYVNVNDLATNLPWIDHVQTWNDACAGCVTFTGFKSNITDTSSNAASLLMDLQVGGVSKFKIDKSGNVTIAGSTNVTSHCYAANVCDFFGSGSPETVLSANVGSTYRRTDGGANATFYVKESGTGNTGWAPK